MRTSKYHGDLAPGGYQGLLQVSRYARGGSIEAGLRELVQIRASQINGCAFCLDMHASEALRGGEDQRRLNLLAAWRDAPGFTPRERAALAWAEALTLLPARPVKEALWADLSEHFTEQERVDLTYSIALINAWNRLCAAFLPDLPEVTA